MIKRAKKKTMSQKAEQPLFYLLIYSSTILHICVPKFASYIDFKIYLLTSMLESFDKIFYRMVFIHFVVFDFRLWMPFIFNTY